MEAWERNSIDRNLPDLLHCTHASVQLLAILQAQHKLTLEEANMIQHLEKYQERPRILYQIIMTRSGGYMAILRALEKTNQSEAAQILRKELSFNLNTRQTTVQDNESLCVAMEDTSIHLATSAVSNEYDKFLSDNSSRVLLQKSKKVLILCSLDVQLSVQKLTKYLKNNDISMKLERKSLWKLSRESIIQNIRYMLNRNTKVLSMLVVVDSANQNNQKRLASLSRYLNMVGRLDKALTFKIILVTPSSTKEVSISVLSKLNHGIIDQVGVLPDPFEWMDLTPSYQETVLKKQIYDQGKLVTLINFCKTYVYADQEQFYKDILRGKMLIDLIVYERPPVVFRQTIPVPRSGYINRRLRPRFNIHCSIFQNFSDADVIAVSGFETLEDFKLFAGTSNGNFDTAENQIDTGINANFVLLCADVHLNTLQFGEICKITQNGKNIHWLHHECRKILWKDTRGNISHIQSHIRPHEQENVVSENFLYSSNRQSNAALILCDTAGMGKSVLLAKIAHETQKSSDSIQLVFFIVLTDFITSINVRLNSGNRSIANEELENAIFEELNSQTSNYHLLKDILGQATGSHTRLCLFFDGLDEVAIDLLDITFSCLGIIKHRFRNTRIHVTTRPHLLEKLEKCLGTLGYNMEPFNTADQINFLTRFWCHDSVVLGKEVNLKGLRKFTTDCLNLIHTSLSKVEKHIAGVPLQCLLIGEAFDKEGKEHACQENKLFSKLPTASIKINSLVDLYDKMVKKKFQRLSNPDKVSLNSVHFYLGTEALFAGSDWVVKLRPLVLTVNVYQQLLKMFPRLSVSLSEFLQGKLPKEELSRLGILENLGEGMYQFVHRTFAEYFIAKCVTESIAQRQSSDMLSFIDETVLETFPEEIVFSQFYNISKPIFRFKHTVICLFINIFLHSIRICDYSKLALVSANLKKIVIASTLENLTNIYQIYKSTFTQKHDFEWYQKALFCSILASSEQMFNDFSSNSEMWLEQMLGIAAEQGNLKMMVHIYSRLGAKEIFDSWIISRKQGIINACVINTLKVDTDVLENKRKILSSLTNKDTTVFVQHNDKHGSPLFQHGIHIELLKCMLEQIKSNDLLIAKDKANKYVLHRPAEYLSSSDYEKLLQFLKDRHQSVLSPTGLTFCRDEFGQTPIHTVIKHMEPSNDVIELLLKAKGNRNKIDKIHNNVIWIALKYNRSAKCLKTVMKLSKLYEGEHNDKFGRSPLHIAAKYVTDEEIWHCLLDDKHEVNHQDIKGNTPIFYALSNPKPHLILPFLLSCDQIDYRHRNKEGKTILHIIAEIGSVQILDLCESYVGISQSVCLTDNNGNTPLHCALRCPTGNKLKMVKKLMNFFPSSFKTKNKHGKCPLMYALTRKHVGASFDLVEHFVLKTKPQSCELLRILDEYFNQNFKNLCTDEKSRCQRLQNLIENNYEIGN